MRRYLLDTHVLLWIFDNNPTIAKGARAAISEADIVYASDASIWEIVIKKSLGKLDAPDNLEEAIAVTGTRLLPITTQHILAVGELPLGDHKDPFDRLLVAQAKVEGLTLITRDRHLGVYGVPIIEA